MVVGTGYTNHCPECFWSKHVDVFPGDRRAACGGLMSPVAIESESDTFIVTQCCRVCGHTRRNRIGSADNMAALVGIAKTLADQKNKEK